MASYCLSDETNGAIDKDSVLQSDLELKYLDLPLLHQYDEQLQSDFFSALAETEDMTLFENKGVMKLIEFRWPLVREFVIKKLFFPFLIFLLTFVIYMGQVYEWREYEGFIY